MSFLVDVEEGRIWKRHIDHLKIRYLTELITEFNETTIDNPVVSDSIAVESPSTQANHDTSSTAPTPSEASDIPGSRETQSSAVISSSPTRSISPVQNHQVPMPRQSTLIRNAPECLRF